MTAPEKDCGGDRISFAPGLEDLHIKDQLINGSLLPKWLLFQPAKRIPTIAWEWPMCVCLCVGIIGGVQRSCKGLASLLGDFPLKTSQQASRLLSSIDYAAWWWFWRRVLQEKTEWEFVHAWQHPHIGTMSCCPHFFHQNEYFEDLKIFDKCLWLLFEHFW